MNILKKYNITATWQAITSLPIEHFPMILPKVHPIAAFFILRRLKHLGYSNCRVTASGNGIVVYAVK
ncbi:MAG: hypothetical protein A2079_04475 [Geobacteraceae bacterium GWC2_48_7]|nr:MAG: hypothetical protein A2079_04475 [Geobacteraceae bacterium GWC2_48_7]